MIRVNLLPEAERQPLLPVNKILFAFSASIIFICVLLYSFNLFTIWNIEREIADSRSKYQQLVPLQTKKNDADLLQQSIQAKNTVLSSLTQQRFPWHSVIAHITAIVPAKIWLSEIAINKNVIKIVGLANSYPDVADFIRRMEQDNILAEPVLVKAETSPDPTKPVTRFELTVKVKGMK